MEPWAARPDLPPNRVNVHGCGWAHAEVVTRDGDDARRIFEHADLDLEVTALQGQLAEGPLLLAERDGDLDALGVNGHMRGRDQGHAQHDQANQPEAQPAPCTAGVDHRFGVGDLRMSCGQPFRRAQLGRARARIARALFVAGGDHVFGQNAQTRLDAGITRRQERGSFA